MPESCCTQTYRYMWFTLLNLTQQSCALNIQGRVAHHRLYLNMNAALHCLYLNMNATLLPMSVFRSSFRLQCGRCASWRRKRKRPIDFSESESDEQHEPPLDAPDSPAPLAAATDSDVSIEQDNCTIKQTLKCSSNYKNKHPD